MESAHCQPAVIAALAVAGRLASRKAAPVVVGADSAGCLVAGAAGLSASFGPCSYCAQRAKRKMLRPLWNHADAIEKEFFTLRPEQRVMPPFAAEIASARFLRLLGIGTAPHVMVMTSAEAAKLDRRNWIFKDADGKARWGNVGGDDNALAVARISGAVPLSYLREQFGISAEIPVIEDGRTRVTMGGVLWKGKADPPNAGEFYADFQPHWWERAKIREAIKWDSEPMLKIHAARLFLGCTTAHASNILVNAEGQLFSIDHADVARTDGSEIDLLFQNVRPGTVAFDALGMVARLPVVAVRDYGEAGPYYLDRLRKWKRLYSGSRSGV